MTKWLSKLLALSTYRCTLEASRRYSCMQCVVSHAERKIMSASISASQLKTMSSSQVSIIASPAIALVDEPLDVEVNGLQPAQNVTIAAVLEEDGHHFVSFAHYTADPSGNVRVKENESKGGSYKGLAPMGLLTHMIPAETESFGYRMIKKNAAEPFRVRISVLPGHCVITRDTDPDLASALASADLRRFYLAHNVRRVPVRAGRVRGTVFIPEGDGPFPGVVDMFGTAGGLNEYRAALLASRGFVAFALAYFGYDDLPEGLRFDMEYFDEAIDWLHRHPNVSKSGIGTLGVSKGAELSLHMARHHKVKAAVSINSYFYHSSAEQFQNGEPFPTVFPNLEAIDFSETGWNFRRSFIEVNAPEETRLKVEETPHAQLLLIHGGDDEMCGSIHYERLVERLQTHGRDNYRLIVYPGAGHLIEPPYTPLCRFAYHKVVGNVVDFGGKTDDHAIAQEDSWNQILEFFRKNLGATQFQSKL